MNDKSKGIADAVASVSPQDEELEMAAVRLMKNRKQTAKDNEQIASVHPITKNAPNAERRSSPKERATAKQTWGQPTALLNTRIPPELDQLLDEELSKKKRNWKQGQRKGTTPTKQSIIIAALAAYLATKKR